MKFHLLPVSFFADSPPCSARNSFIRSLPVKHKTLVARCEFGANMFSITIEIRFIVCGLSIGILMIYFGSIFKEEFNVLFARILLDWMCEVLQFGFIKHSSREMFLICDGLEEFFSTFLITLTKKIINSSTNKLFGITRDILNIEFEFLLHEWNYHYKRTNTVDFVGEHSWRSHLPHF